MTSPSQRQAPVVASVRPAPEPAVLAAIIAAVEQAWPRPAEPEPSPSPTASWRFSGRWWSRPSTARRERPWVRPG
ncbi:MAG TPA: hypothetical protein VMV14_08240 [Acidimicrobiales bacterium]|nr:hypothetical protein [Acidimicrobiales bacterium]